MSAKERGESDMDQERPGTKNDYGRGKALKRKKKGRHKKGRG